MILDEVCNGFKTLSVECMDYLSFTENQSDVFPILDDVIEIVRIHQIVGDKSVKWSEVGD